MWLDGKWLWLAEGESFPDPPLTLPTGLWLWVPLYTAAAPAENQARGRQLA